MKHIEALIPHDLIQDVAWALTSIGIPGLTLTTVYHDAGCINGQSGADGECFLGRPSCKLDVLICSEDLPRVQAALRKAAGISARLQIVVMDLESMIRIRTGEPEQVGLG